MKILLILLLLISPAHFDNPPPVSWPTSLHQKVIVQATSLMPESIARRILIHRKDILRGCVDTLKKGINHGEEFADIKLSYNRLTTLLGSKNINFRMICYEMGRLSTLLSEASSPIHKTISPGNATSFGNFVLQQSGYFPLIITREGEGFIKEKDLSSYLSFQQKRKEQQAISLSRAIKLYPDRKSWKGQRSLQFGIASVVYNNMILDTSRIWMMAWEEAGGTVADAPYFAKRK